jgi:2-polyprenyl-3-methyl-5-hydroxy-6-metoxy-1,4-benzoquinol methylase
MHVEAVGRGEIVPDERYRSSYEQNRASIIRTLIPLGHGRHALDLGCGPGFYSRILAEKGWVVTSVDLEETNIAAAARFAHRTIAGDVLAVLPALPDNTFDLVLALELIEHMPQGARLPQEVLRVVRPEGLLIISTPNRLSPEGLGGYYWGEKIRGWGKWNAWNDTHVKIYTSFEFLGLLERFGWTIQKVVGYWYYGLLPLGVWWTLPVSSTPRFPLNRFGFNTIAVCSRTRSQARAGARAATGDGRGLAS